jgi:hypothetical protein
MPITRTPRTTGGQFIPPPFVGPVHHRVAVPLLLTTLTAFEIDANGWLKPMVPLQKSGAIISGAAQVVYGVTVDYVKVAADNATATIAALGTIDVVIAYLCAINRKAAEAVLGRVYNANELAGFALAGGHVVLLS